MKLFKGGAIIGATRSAYLRRKTVFVVSSAVMVFLLCIYIALLNQISTPSFLLENKLTFIDSSFWLSSRVGMQFINNATTASAYSPEKTTKIWNEILRNKTSTSRIGIHVLRPGKPATNIIVLGERHSGTTFFTKYLTDCFPNIDVRDTFVNNKHWIQHDPEYVFSYDSDHSPLFRQEILNAIDGMLDKDTKSKQQNNLYFHNSLVLVLFRNPYDWVEAMRRKPWHWPNHVSLFPFSAQNVSLEIKAQYQDNGAKKFKGGHSVQKSYVGYDLLDWKDFIGRRLYLEEHDNEEVNPLENNEVSETRVCQKGYALNTISPCRRNESYAPTSLRSIPKAFLRHLPFDTHNPIYEQNPINGKPFENLLQLRALKVRNFLSLPEKWELAGIGFIQYDSLLGNSLKSLTEEIGRNLGIRNSSGGISNITACPSTGNFQKAPYNLTDDFRDWITETVQWDVESMIDFHQPMP